MRIHKVPKETMRPAEIGEVYADRPLTWLEKIKGWWSNLRSVKFVSSEDRRKL